MTISTYSATRYSGIIWLGDVPSHWEVRPLKHLISLRSGGTPSKARHDFWEGSVPWASAKDLKAAKLSDTTDRLTDLAIVEEGVGLNPTGSILILVRGMMLARAFPVVETLVPMAINQDLKAVNPKPGMTSSFLAWTLRGTAQESLDRCSEAGHGTKALRMEDWLTMPFPAPPLDEQVSIAAFLDRETCKIDRLIEKQHRLIALLTEKRQAVISHAVTKGLDPRAPVKDSGIEWLGEVPVHWDVIPLKHLISLRSGGTPSKAREDYWEGLIPWASAKDLKSERLTDTIDHLSEVAVSEGGAELNPPGSILILVRGMMLARAFPVSEIAVPMAINQDLKAILPTDGMLAQFLAWALRGTAKQSLDRCSEAGHGTKALRMEDWLSMPLPRPSQDEQKAIAALLDEETRKIDNLVETAGSAIALLNERRAALISAAVTGKIDVRGSAKVLPFPVDRARARGLIATEIIERSAHQTTFGRVKFQKIAFLAEAHVGINEIKGSYTREAAGPLDRTLIDEMESGAHSIAGIEHEQPGGPGTTVSYRLGERPGAHRQELADWLGAERTAMLDKLITDCASLTTKQAEAVATLYGVWNDALSEGTSPTEDEIISEFLNDWHPEKREKFRGSELPEWLDWMRRHDIVPTGSGPKTTTGRLFV